jgi:hypothetical protein
MDSNGNKTEIETKTLELLHDFANGSFITSLDIIDKLDQKLVTLISVDGIIISILFSISSFSNKLFFYICICFIFSSLVLGVCGYIPKSIYAVDTYKTWVDYYGYKYDRAIAQLTSNLVEAWKRNKHIADIKGSIIAWGFFTLVAGIVFLFIDKIR